MASQVLSGSSNVSYTNNTGQNVRIVINYMAGVNTSTTSAVIYQLINMSWAGVSVSAPLTAIGRNLAFNNNGDGIPSTGSGYSIIANNAYASGNGNSVPVEGALPTELMLAPGQTFSASCGVYNVVIIPEAG